MGYTFILHRDDTVQFLGKSGRITIEYAIVANVNTDLQRDVIKRGTAELGHCYVAVGDCREHLNCSRLKRIKRIYRGISEGTLTKGPHCYPLRRCRGTSRLTSRTSRRT